MKEMLNKVKLVGFVSDDPVLDREVEGVKFYTFELAVERKSGTVDKLPITTSEYNLETVMAAYDSQEPIFVYGKLKTYNKIVNHRRRLIVHIYSEHIHYAENYRGDYNSVEIEGHICKAPIKRVTPLSNKQVLDSMIVNREIVTEARYGCEIKKKEIYAYIPIIAWEELVDDYAKLPVSSFVGVRGRIQSREYQKTDDKGKTHTRKILELSISTYYELEEEDA